MAEEEDILVAAEEEGGEDIFDVEGFADDAAKSDPLAALKRRHPETQLVYLEEIASLLSLTASPPLGKDPRHRSPPFLTQYERTKIIGMRANQLSQAARPYIKVPEYVTNVSEIARMELEARRLPYIVRRSMPDGTNEYWRLSDLLIL